MSSYPGSLYLNLLQSHKHAVKLNCALKTSTLLIVLEILFKGIDEESLIKPTTILNHWKDLGNSLNIII